MGSKKAGFCHKDHMEHKEQAMIDSLCSLCSLWLNQSRPFRLLLRI